MKLKNVLIAVGDMERSKRFYKELFGLDVVSDNGENVVLTEGLVLQDSAVWSRAMGRPLNPRNNMTELFFEERDMDSFIEKLKHYEEPLEYVTHLRVEKNGRIVIRFYDPDGNLIEVCQPAS